MKKKSMGVWFYVVLVFIVGIMTFLFWKQITVPKLSSDLPYYSDMVPYLYEGTEAKTNLWYSIIGPLVWLLHQCTRNETITAFLMALMLALANGAVVLMVRHWYCVTYKKSTDLAVEILSFSSVFVTMLYSPFGVNGWWWRQSASPNVWHNPTNMLCRLFSFLSVFCLYYIFFARAENRSVKKYLWLNAGAALLSMWAKPSFFASFLPALCLCLLIELIRTKGKSFKFALTLGLSYLPSMSILVYQYIHLYITPTESVGKSGIAFGLTRSLFGIIHKTVTSSLFLLLAFVLIYIFGKKKNMGLIFSFIWYTISSLIPLFIYENGHRIGHDNFGWSLSLCLFFLFMYTAGEIFFPESEVNISKKWIKISGVIYSLHLITGIAYFIKLLCGGLYY